MAMYKALCPRDDLDRVYGSRKEEGRGPTNIKDYVDAPIQGFEEKQRKTNFSSQLSTITT